MMSLFIATAGIIREFPPAMGDFLQHKGIELLLHCLSCDHDKLIIKALFLLTSISANIRGHISGQLLWYLVVPAFKELSSNYLNHINDH